MNPRLAKLPVLVISAHSRCNCRCGMCDIWRNTDSVCFSREDLARQLDDIRALGVESVVFTGGEPLLNPDLFPMAAMLREHGIRVTLLSTGLLVARYAREIASGLDDLIVSLDGPRGVHDRIRGVIGAFDQLAAGVRAVRKASPEFPVAARCTVQRANHHSVRDTATAAKSLELNWISYLAVDISSAAFNHDETAFARLKSSLLLNDLEIRDLEREFRLLKEGPLSSMVAESEMKLARIVEYFRAMAEGREPQAPRCNAPWVSAVVEQDGLIRPCFFHPGFGNVKNGSLAETLNAEPAIHFRRTLNVADNPTCRRCVCSLYRAEGKG
ncbi:MAG TPA: radical SAM protein [Bryobacteraceae bacterium]|nr:radical SAM protein [Bryobacteraceae bacterium]